MPIKITEDVRAKALRRPLKPSVTRDRDVPGLCLHVTTRRSFWALSYQPRGVNPATGKRWGGGVRHELADAMLVGVAEARGLALAAKALVRQGRSPHHEQMASRASVEAARGILPVTMGDALDAYERALMTRLKPSLWTRRQSVRYARRAVMLLSASALPIGAIDVRMVRMLVETAPGAPDQRRHVFGGLSRFLGWALKQELISVNPCAALDKHDRPGPGRSRSHVPSLAALRLIWAMVEDEDEPARDLIRFMLLMPLRRSEVAGLKWSEVDFDQGRVRIGADRTKNGEPHELPLPPAALAILGARKLVPNNLVFATPEGRTYKNWNRLLTRIRKAIGEGDADRDNQFNLHDTRRAFVSHLAGQFDADALDQCLGHRRAGVAGIYQRSARWPERVAALNLYAALIAGAELERNVLPFARRADV
jgi:integrase